MSASLRKRPSAIEPRCVAMGESSETLLLAAHVPLPLLFAVAFLSPTPSSAQLNVITSVGFEAAYNELVPVFQKSSGITVSTKHFASQGSGPDTIAAQLRAGAAADVVIMSKDGLGELLADGRIIPASAVDLAQVQLGVAVRAGAPKPDISTVDAFRQMLLSSKSINALSGPSFVRSANPRRKSLIAPGTQPASIAKRMESSKSLTQSLRNSALETTPTNSGKLRCARQSRKRRRGNGRL